jgi:hypothetical protein
VRLTEVGRTSAVAVLLGDDGEPVAAAADAQEDPEADADGTPKRRRGRRGGRRRKAAAGTPAE